VSAPSGQQLLDFAERVPAPPGASLAVAAPSPAPQGAASPAELWAAVQFLPDPPDATQAAATARREALLGLAQRFTPRAAFEPPDGLLLEVAGSRRVFGGLHGLLCSLRQCFPAPHALAVAPTPLAALLLARAGQARCITNPARLAGRLAPLPVALLRWPEADLERLRSMGVATLGELLRLPREGLARRFGPPQLAMLDRLTGRRADPRAAQSPAERYTARVDPGFETADAGRLVTALSSALDGLEHFLRGRQRGVTALRLLLVHRRSVPAVLVLRLAVPEYRAARFTALLAARLESLQLAEPVRRIEMAAGRLRPLSGRDGALWRPGEQGGGGATDTPEFLQALMARLGERSVYGLALVPEHRPERQWRSVWPGSAASPPMAEAMPDYRGRPLGLLDPPRRLEVEQDAGGRTQRLLHQGRALALLAGPERIESGWWDGAEVARDYYTARADDGTLWWVFRECGAQRRWYVHGCFA
jgi:protein ImuB